MSLNQGHASGLGSCVMFFFSSRRRHTRFDCDWSSDVCSSDLAKYVYHESVVANLGVSHLFPGQLLKDNSKGLSETLVYVGLTYRFRMDHNPPEIGRASCRERV